MSLNGSGVYNVNSAGQPVVSNTLITAAAFNAFTADIATALSTAIFKDGQQTCTARIPFAAGISSTLVTDATSSTTGSIITAGGISCQKALVVGTTITAASINFGGSALNNYTENTFVPTVTLVGGAGNTVPVYTTNTGRYTRVGNRVFVDIYLTGDGGAEGAGTGALTIALPITSSASSPPSAPIPVGWGINNTFEYFFYGDIGSGSGTITLRYFATISSLTTATGADQNNTLRSIRLSFNYEV